MINRHIPWLTSTARLVRLAIVAALFVGFAAIALTTFRFGPGVALVAAAAPMFFLLAFSQLEYAALFILSVAALVRFTLPTGTESRVVSSMVLTAIFVLIWVVRMLMVEKHFRLTSRRITIPLLGFVATVIFSYVWSNAFRDPLVRTWSSWPFVQLATLAMMLLLPAAFLLTANTIRSPRALKAIAVLVGAAGTIYLLIFLVMMSVPPVARTAHTALSQFNVGGLFSMWFSAIVYSQVLFNRRLKVWGRVALIGILALWAYRFFIVGVTWLAGWLVPAVALAVMSFFRSKRLFLVLLLLVAIYVALNWDYWAYAVAEREADESWYTRLEAYRQNWRVTGKHILFGTGPSGYAVYYMTYFPTAAMASHSDYIDLLAQTGIVGFLFYLVFFAMLVRMAYRLIRRLKGQGDFHEAFANATFAGALGCIFAMAIGTWMIPFVYTASLAGFDHAVYSWILLGTVVALDRLVASADDTVDTSRALD
jgi:hypothetical protein